MLCRVVYDSHARIMHLPSMTPALIKGNCSTIRANDVGTHSLHTCASHWYGATRHVSIIVDC
jgi:hypothetical protein